MIKKGFQPLKFATWSENPGCWVSSVLNCIQLSFFPGIHLFCHLAQHWLISISKTYSFLQNIHKILPGKNKKL